MIQLKEYLTVSQLLDRWRESEPTLTLSDLSDALIKHSVPLFVPGKNVIFNPTPASESFLFRDIAEAFKKSGLPGLKGFPISRAEFTGERPTPEDKENNSQLSLSELLEIDREDRRIQFNLEDALSAGTDNPFNVLVDSNTDGEVFAAFDNEDLAYLFLERYKALARDYTKWILTGKGPFYMMVNSFSESYGSESDFPYLQVNEATIEVKLSDVLALEKELTIGAEQPPADEQQADGPQLPIAPVHMTEDIELLLMAARRFWDNASPRDNPKEFTDRETIWEWLSERDPTMSNKVREAITTIIRPDWTSEKRKRRN